MRAGIHKIYAFLLLLLVLLPVAGFSRRVFVLYGFKLGQNKATAEKQFGRPFKAHTFPDGFSYCAFMRKDHVVVIQSDSSRPDLIWAVQIQGRSNPSGHGLAGVNLGDPEVVVQKMLGKPDRVRTAVDEETKKPLTNIRYYSYHETSNYSVEVQNGKVSSIKVVFSGPSRTRTGQVPLKDFFAAIRKRDLPRLAALLRYDFTYMHGKNFRNSTGIRTSIIHTLTADQELNRLFFDAVSGLVSFTAQDAGRAVMRLTDAGTGYVYTVKRGSLKYELYFIMSFEGWVLRTVWKNGG